MSDTRLPDLLRHEPRLLELLERSIAAYSLNALSASEQHELVDALNAHPFKALSVDERAAVLHVFSAASKLPRNE